MRTESCKDWGYCTGINRDRNIFFPLIYVHLLVTRKVYYLFDPVNVFKLAVYYLKENREVNYNTRYKSKQIYALITSAYIYYYGYLSIFMYSLILCQIINECIAINRIVKVLLFKIYGEILCTYTWYIFHNLL